MPFSNRLLFIFALPLAIWVVVSLVSAVTLQHTLMSYENLDRSQDVLKLANAYRHLPEILRNEERVYLTTGAKDALLRHRELMKEANVLYTKLKSMLRDHSRQQERLEIAASRLQEWYYDVSMQRIQATVDGEAATGIPRDNLDRAVALIRDFLTATRALIEAEEKALDQYRKEVKTGGAVIELTIWLGLVLGALSMFTVIMWIRRRIGLSIKGLNAATEEFSRGNFSARVSGDAENELSRRFNTMADWVQRRNEDLVHLAELGEVLNSCRTSDEAVRVFNDFASILFPVTPGALYLVEPDKIDVRLRTSWGGGHTMTMQNIALDDCWALRMGRIHRSRPGQRAHCIHLLVPDLIATCVPLPAFGEVIGFLFLVDQQETVDTTGKPFSYMVAQQIALAFANVRLREMLEQQAIRDPLTQLYNRRHLDEVIKLELYRSQRHGTPLSVMVFDIDHFKNFNDQYGHDGGDAVLKHISTTVQSFFRPEDSVFRSGGEEFVVLIPDTNHEDALERANALRQLIAHEEVQHGNIEFPPVTISVGVATSAKREQGSAQLLKAADQALYRAKREGRNRVVSAAGV